MLVCVRWIWFGFVLRWVDLVFGLGWDYVNILLGLGLG